MRTHNKLLTPVQVGATLHKQTKQKEGLHVLPSDLAVRADAEKSRDLA
jgi:hypothetical protein